MHRRRHSRLVAELHFRWENTCAALQTRRPAPVVLMGGVSYGRHAGTDQDWRLVEGGSRYASKSCDVANVVYL